MPDLQPTYAPGSICWGCGPANSDGLGLVSRPEGDAVVAKWTPEPHHQAFPGVLNGGIIGTLLDCHSNWAAAYHLMVKRGAAHPPVTVTSEYTVRLHRPTPVDGALRLTARVTESEGHRVTVAAEILAGGEVTASCTGLFVAVRDDHLAAQGW